jgi:glycosyltransferase involved in cell wall biosynthesis
MLVSVVTPSYNQGAYLEKCIESVRDNGYPFVEHIVMDGGSTDATLDVLRRHEHTLAAWRSAPDGGQADAVNRGWSMCHGQVLAFLNSDDYYMPGAIRRAVEVFTERNDVGLVYGQALFVDAAGVVLRQTHVMIDGQEMLDGFVGLPQPAVFIHRRVIERIGVLDPSFHFALDGEFFMRAIGNFKAIALNEVFAFMRVHKSAKSVAQGAGFAPEILRIAHKVAGRPANYPRYHVEPRKVEAGACVVSAKFLYMNGAWRVAIRRMAQAFTMSPAYRKRILVAETPRLVTRMLLGREGYGKLSDMIARRCISRAED